MWESDESPASRDSADVRDERTRRVTAISRAFTYATSVDEILTLATDQAAAILHAEKAVLLLADADGMLQVHASRGIDENRVTAFRETLDESLSTRIRRLVSSDARESFIGVPIVTKGLVVGLLAVIRSDDRPITDEDEWLLSSLADQTAAPLENARLARELEQANLVNDNVRLLESERAARKAAEEARARAEDASRQAEAARDVAIVADRSKTAFLAAMSHELRTPLNAIGGYVDLLEMGLRGPLTPAQLTDLQRIKTNQRHLLGLISDVLEFARIGAGQTEYNITELHLAVTLDDIEVMVEPQLVLRSVKYEFERCDPEIVVLADATKLRQIVLNLVSNAIKFTPAGGSVRVRCLPRPAAGDEAAAGANMVAIEVADTGVGIPADKLDAIWHPFVQVDRQLNQPAEGVGLGLAISRNFARGMGGDITVRSIHGSGSTFVLTIPRAG